MRETWVQSLGWEDLLEKEMAPHSSILAWKIPWTKEPAGYSPWGHKELDTTERLHFHLVILLWHCPSLASFSVEFNVSFSRLIFLLCFMATTPSPSWFWSTSCYSSALWFPQGLPPLLSKDQGPGALCPPRSTTAQSAQPGKTHRMDECASSTHLTSVLPKTQFCPKVV